MTESTRDPNVDWDELASPVETTTVPLGNAEIEFEQPVTAEYFDPSVKDDTGYGEYTHHSRRRDGIWDGERYELDQSVVAVPVNIWLGLLGGISIILGRGW